MENKDKNIDKHFRKLSEEQEPKSFPNMDKVWENIEQKLDRKETKKVVPLWKYAGVAAALLVFVTLGIQFMNNRSEKEEFPIDNEQRIVIDERKAKEILDEELESKEDIYAFEEVENQEENKQDKTQFIQTPVKKDSEVITTQSDFDDMTVSGRENNGYVETEETALSKVEDKSETITLVAEQQKDLKQIKGIIRTEYGDPIPGASVLLVGSNQGAETDLEGTYSLNAKQGDRVKVAFEGFKPVTLRISSSDVLNFTMVEEDPFDMTEVVVDTYRTTSKERVVTGTSTVTSQTIEGRPNASVIQTLQGQVPGLNIATGSGQPGTSNSIILRGLGSVNSNREPLYVIDGAPMSADKFRSLNQKDIENITVLKDAGATAIYGNRGANGVINITTKKRAKKKKQKREKKRKTRICFLSRNSKNVSSC